MMSGMARPLRPSELGPRLAGVYQVLGPLYRAAQRRVETDEPVMGMSVGVRAVLDELTLQAPATVPELARRLGLSRQFVQRMVNDARDAHWVTLLENPAHARSSLIDLSGRGESAIHDVHEREHELMGRVGGRLTAQDVETTLRVLREMLATLERLETEPPAQ
jgi:DNA-binding MarR family transcriptional regulator